MDQSSRPTRHLVESMSLERRIGQLFMVGFPGTVASGEIIELIQHRHVGGIILFSRNIGDAPQVFELTSQLQALAKETGHAYPLLIATDQENGMVQRLGSAVTPLPGNMALGAIGDAQVVAEVSELTGRELKQLGINMNLAPVVDVNNNAANPVIGVRSFGEDASTVAHLSAAAVRGYHAAGTIPSLKHFPGHGDTATDSHLGLPVLPATLEQLRALEFLPFKSGIREGADTVMVAHVALPRATGTSLPATLSPAIVRGLLRQELGYDGVVVSDCLEMDAVAKTVGTARGAVMALQAGIDLVLVSHSYARQQESIQAVHEALAHGELDPATITLAAQQVLDLKARYLSWATLLTALGDTNHIRHQQLTKELYARSTTLVRDEVGLLPIDCDDSRRILVVASPPESVSNAADLVYPHQFLVECIRQQHPNTQDICLESERAESFEPLLRNLLATADLVIVATINAHLDRRQAALMKYILQSGKPTIGLAIANPYDLSVFPRLGTYLATYEYTMPALAAAVEVLFGKAEAGGRLPVTIPGIAKS
ncbi:MAG: beta-N-acetylhexosaminidase [Ktedonobacterales bacterium]